MLEKLAIYRYKQEEINELIRKYAIEGNIVARLKGGDATLLRDYQKKLMR